MRLLHFSKIITVLLAVVSLSACVTLQDGERMQAQIDQLSSRQSALDESFAENREQFAAMVQQASEDVSQIKKVLDDATALMQRNSADFGADFERFQQEFSSLRGKVETLTFNLEKLEKDLTLFKEDVDLRFSTSPPPTPTAATPTDTPPPSLGSNPDSMLASANELLRLGKYDDAKETYFAFLSTFPDDPNTPQATFGLGEAELKLQNPKAAGKQFEKILSKYPQSEYIDDAFFKLGEVFVALKSCVNAEKFYRRIISKYKDSPWVAKSKARIKAIEDKELCK